MLDANSSNCSVVTPDVVFMLLNLTAIQITVLICEGVVCIFLIIFFVYECYHFGKKTISESPRLQSVLFIQSTFVFYATTSFLAVISPRSSTLTELVFTVYFSFTLKELLSLMISYLGGDNYAIPNVNGAPASLAVTPFACMCCWCCPRVYMNRKCLFRVKVAVYQSAILHTILDFISAFLWTNDLYVRGDISLQKPSLYLEIAEKVSILIAIYALTCLFWTAQQQLKQYHILGKFLCVQITMVISGFQGNFFNILMHLGLIECKHILSAADRAAVLHHLIVVPEMLIVFVASHYFHTLEEDIAEPRATQEVTGGHDEQTDENELLLRSEVPDANYQTITTQSDCSNA